jgi:hypothetical protein
MDERVDRAGAKIGAARRKAAFVFIFATILLDMLAMGIVIPVLPKHGCRVGRAMQLLSSCQCISPHCELLGRAV